MEKLPLLGKGYVGNQPGQYQLLQVAAGALIIVNNTLPQGRGRAVAVDVIAWRQTPVSANQGKISVAVGGVKIKENEDLFSYIVQAYPRSNEYTVIDGGEGQTLQLTLDNTNSGAINGAIVHVFFDNPFAIGSVMNARFNKSMQLPKEQDFFPLTAVPAATKSTINSFTVPKQKGRIVAIEVIAYNSTGSLSDLALVLITSISIDGVSVFELMSAAYFSVFSSRPGLIFPIVFQGGVQIITDVDSSQLAAGTTVIGIRLYYDGTNV